MVPLVKGAFYWFFLLALFIVLLLVLFNISYS